MPVSTKSKRPTKKSVKNQEEQYNNLFSNNIFSFLNFIESRFNSLKHRIEENKTEINNRIDKLGNKVDSHFKWLLGIMITGFISLFVFIGSKL